MQNKGFIKVFATLLALVSLYYLSFTIVGQQYNKKAEQYANGNLELKNQYLDSLSTETVYFGYTLKQIREKEIGLGLDLKGGMNVIVEMDVHQILTSLANTDDPQFNEALKEATVQNRKGSSSDFITLFRQNYEKINPNGKLANIFSVTMSDRVSPTSTNDQVIAVLRQEVASAAENSFNVLRTRIDRFGVVAPNIQRLDQAERILIEMPGITEPERVRNLLQGSANLEFWKTYNVNELASYFNEANSRSAEYAMAKRSGATAETAADSTSIDIVVETNILEEEEGVVEINRSFVEYFAQPYFAMGGASGPIVGTAAKTDTAAINFILNKYKDIFPADVRFKWGFKPIDTKETFFELYSLKGDGTKRGPALDGDAVVNAKADQGQSGSAWEVSMTMNSAGASRWANITGAEKGKSIAIVLDNYVYSAPNVNDRIEGGRSSISGRFTASEAGDLENVLKSGKMRAGVRIVQEDVVGPSLGQEAIKDGVVSFIIAIIALFIFIFFLYGAVPGMVTNSALLINFFLTLGILSAFQAVLTLPGIAGMILSLGMAVDANVLINERIKEEMKNGKSLRKSIEDGYKNAFSAIIDSNITTIITAIILAFFGTGPIKGFAVTLIIGISVSFLTAVFLTRIIYEARMDKGKWLNLSFDTKGSKNLFKEYTFDFLKGSRRVLTILAVFVVVSLASLLVLKLNTGIDFTGGRNYIVRFDQPVKTGDIEDALNPHFDGSAQVITIGSSNQVRISTNFMIDSESTTVEEDLKEIMGVALKDYIASGKTIDDYIQSSQKVGPSVAEDTLKNAVFALVLALIFMGIYILVRFRNWSFSAGTVAALAVDAFSVIGLYSLLWKVMPFSMEIDQTFIAAILTVIGYSINDKVVVFDRVRENFTLYPKRDLRQLFNDSMNAVLARTINTGLSTILVILVILFFGGDAVRSFVFAMLIGVVIGTMTSLFLATPVAFSIMTKQKAKKELEAK